MSLVEKLPPERLSSSDVNACIRKFFGAQGDQYAVLFEVRNGTAWRANRSIDAVVMPLWPSLGMHLTGMEVKVSRNDWVREYRNPGKASEVFDYFDKWYLVAPADCVKDGELPEPWGWYQPINGTLRLEKQATLNPTVKPVDRHFLASIMRNQVRVAEGPMNQAVDAALREQNRQHQADIDKRVLQQLGTMREVAQEWATVKELLTGKPDGYLYQKDVIEALKILLKCGIGKSHSSLRTLLDYVNSMQANLSEIATDLGVDKPPVKKRRTG